MTALSPQTIALQLYTVRDLTASDLIGTLKTVAGIGYQAVEFAGLGTVDPKLVRATLTETGLVAAGAHIPLTRWESDPTGVLDELETLGAPFGGVPMVHDERVSSAAGVSQLAEVFNGLGAAAKARGIGFFFHHHNAEFAPLPDGDGRSMFDVLIAETDPELVGFEVDLYWTVVGNADPAALLKRLAGRTPLVHLKDAATELNDQGIPADKPVGEGTLDWATLIPLAEAAGANYYIVEQDYPADALVDIATSWRYLADLAKTAG